MLKVNGEIAFAAPFRHAIMITPVGDYPGDKCQRLLTTRGDMQPAYPQLEPPIELPHCWSDDSMTSLTRKRSLVQSQYRPRIYQAECHHWLTAWMTAAARRALRVRSGLAAVAEWEAENGPLTSEELDAARSRAGLAGERRTA
jgi:hypothetical protein